VLFNILVWIYTVHFCYCWLEHHRYLKTAQQMQAFYVIKLPCSGEQ